MIQEDIWRLARWLLILAGLYVTSVMTVGALLHRKLPCGNDGGCDVVALSAVAHLGPIPLALLGFVCYAYLAISWWKEIRDSRQAIVGRLLPFAGAAVSTGLSVYSIGYLHAKCGWCLASNIIFCLLALLSCLPDPPAHVEGGRTRTFAAWVGVLFLFAAVPSSVVTTLGKDQLGYDPEAIRVSERTTLISEDSISVGALESAATIVAFVDIDCPACREALAQLWDRAQSGHYRLVIRHCPLADHPRSYAKAVRVESVATDRREAVLLDALNDAPCPSVNEVGRKAAVERVQRDMQTAQNLGIRQTPVLILCEQHQRPKVLSLSDLSAQIER